MAIQKPFKMDSGITAAFEALSDLESDTEREPEFSIGKAVVVGGGTGSPVSIRSLLSLGLETSAVVAMADDGGSTGVLREVADATPPGDIRKCIAAFAENPSAPFTRAFKYRLNIANGHSLGNLLLSVLEDTCDSFPEAIAICEELVGAQGHVYPSTLDHVRLSAVTNDGQVIDGQALACHSDTALSDVSLVSDDERDVEGFAPALDALRDADLIVFGPGSLFTSIIPNILVQGVVEAIRDSGATTLFVCSVADVQGETWGLTASEHVDALLRHGLEGLLDYVLVNSGPDTEAQEGRKVRPVYIDPKEVEAIQSRGPMVILRDLADPERPTWHSPAALREAIQHVIKLSEARERLIR